jgi:hypothetical protein
MSILFLIGGFDAPVDFLLVLDSSKAMGKPAFEKTKKFIIYLVNSARLGKDYIRLYIIYNVNAAVKELKLFGPNKLPAQKKKYVKQVAALKYTGKGFPTAAIFTKIKTVMVGKTFTRKNVHRGVLLFGGMKPEKKQRSVVRKTALEVIALRSFVYYFAVGVAKDNKFWEAILPRTFIVRKIAPSSVKLQKQVSQIMHGIRQPGCMPGYYLFKNVCNRKSEFTSLHIIAAEWLALRGGGAKWPTR